MWETNEIKARGKAAFKLNYWKCVLVSCLMSIVTAGSASVSYNSGSSSNDQELEQSFEQLKDAYSALSPGEQIAVVAGVAGIFTFAFVIGILIKIFVQNPLKVGCLAFFRDNVTNPPAQFSSVNAGFRNYLHTFVTFFLTDLFLTLWTLLFIIPGFIKCYSYRLVPYLIAEHPELSATETITRSREMMQGHKWHAFCYDLSFIGWFILTIFTLGIAGFFWVGPYKDNSDAALYLAIRDGR